MPAGAAEHRWACFLRQKGKWSERMRCSPFPIEADAIPKCADLVPSFLPFPVSQVLSCVRFWDLSLCNCGPACRLCFYFGRLVSRWTSVRTGCPVGPLAR